MFNQRPLRRRFVVIWVGTEVEVGISQILLHFLDLLKSSFPQFGVVLIRSNSCHLGPRDSLILEDVFIGETRILNVYICPFSYWFL